MKQQPLISGIFTIAILCSCYPSQKALINKSGSFNNKSTVVDVETIKLSEELENIATDTDSYSDWSNAQNDSSNIDEGYLIIPEKFKKCLEAANSPKTINDLKYGISLDSYKFEKKTQAKLGFLGFGNVELEDKETAIVVEYKQAGTQVCNNMQLFYGVGARILMKVQSKKRNARVDTPQQISASITYGDANVSYSVKTFGIVGPGVSRLIKSGTMSENTYTDFLNEISALIIDSYQNSSSFTITPQPLFLKQQ